MLIFKSVNIKTDSNICTCRDSTIVNLFLFFLGFHSQYQMKQLRQIGFPDERAEMTARTTDDSLPSSDDDFDGLNDSEETFDDDFNSRHCAVKMGCGDDILKLSRLNSLEKCRDSCKRTRKCHFFTWFLIR